MKSKSSGLKALTCLGGHIQENILNFEYYSLKKCKMYYKNTLENPLAVQWLRLHASSAYKALGMGLNPWSGY